MRMNTLFFVIVSLLISIVTFAEDKKVNFSGEWSLNQEKSQLGEGRRWRVVTKLSVTQKGNDLTIKRTSQGRNREERVTEEVLTLDGKECKSTYRDFPRTSVAKWSKDGKTLTITSKMIFERDGNEFEVNTTEIWSLKEDGKTLSIDSTSKSPRGERKRTTIYNKVKSSE